MRRYLKVLATLSIGLLALLLGTAQPLTADEPNPVTAIDILLEPDATMVKHAEAANERLLKDFPKGFALGKTHQPHISCLQRYVKTADLDKVYEAVGKVLAEEKPTAWKLKAYKYYFIPWKDIGLAGIVIEPTDDLIRYQKKLIDAVAPFTVKNGDRGGVRHHEGRPRHQSTDHRLRDELRAEWNRQEVQPACDDRPRLPGLPEEDARREVRVVHVLAGGGVRLPSRQLRDGSEETQELGVEALRCVSGMRRSPIRGRRRCRRTRPRCHQADEPQSNRTRSNGPAGAREGAAAGPRPHDGHGDRRWCRRRCRRLGLSHVDRGRPQRALPRSIRLPL